MRRWKPETLILIIAAADAALGGMLCIATGRTAAHALTILAAAAFWAGAFRTALTALPNRQSARVQLASAALFAGAWLALLAFYAWHYRSAQNVYIFDDSLYYYQQLELAGQLNLGLPATLRHLWTSLATDYTCVPNLLMAPLFSLTDRSIHGFAFAGVIMAWTPLMFQMYRVTLRFADHLRLRGRRTLLLCAGTCLSIFALPLLHRATAWCQINLLGLPFLLQAVYLSRQIDFTRPQPLRMAGLFLSAVLLVLMRRWFLFFLAGYLPLWGVMTAAALLRRKEHRGLRNLFLYGAVCIAAGALLLWPVLSRALNGNYVVAYEYWKRDGLPYELCNQAWLLGYASCGMILAGYAWGLCQRRSRELRNLSALMGGSAAVALVLFTRIQNMNFHQATILMPAYVLGLMLLFAMIASLSRASVRRGLSLLSGGLLLFQWGMSVTQEKPQDTAPWLSHVSLRPPVRTDLDALRAVNEFIGAHCSEEQPALILCNSDHYDRLTFVNLAYPDLSLREKVALDRTALVSDGFPRMWFAAGCILVPTSPQTNHPGGTVEKLTRHLLADEADRFDVVATFPMDGFDLLAMQRRSPVTYDEYEDMLALFAHEHTLYPAVYGDRMGFFYGLAAGWQ